jgi:uncharacterized protein (TIGR02996 family)
MNLERELLEAILKNPEDITPRLVYADWCDEHGDPRGGSLSAFNANWRLIGAIGEMFRICKIAKRNSSNNTAGLGTGKSTAGSRKRQFVTACTAGGG